MLGNSGAIIETHVSPHPGLSFARKSGGDTDLIEQMMICRYLGENVCPKIKSAGRNWYEMELLSHPPVSELPTITMLHSVGALLRWVWPAAPLNGSPRLWRDELAAQVMQIAPWIGVDVIGRLYGGKNQIFCMTHGDPTLANTMYREDGTVILIDPLPPRTATPSLREVDVGKLLQSVGGWEGVRSGREPSYVNIDSSYVIGACAPVGGFTKEWAAKCYLWAAVHCARVVRHGAVTEEIRVWSEQESRRWTREMERVLE